MSWSKLIGCYEKLGNLTCASSCLWIVFTVCALLTNYLPFLQKIAKHGKCRSSAPHVEHEDYPKSFSSRLYLFVDFLHDLMFIPKKLFVHLYLVGVGCAVFHLRCCLDEEVSPAAGEEREADGLAWLQCHRGQLLLLLWTCHVMRRLLESVLLTHFGSSRMHVGGFVAGVVHYIVVPITLRESGTCAGLVTRSSSSSSSSSLCALDALLVAAPCLLFFAANYQQFQAHAILFRMKTAQTVSAAPREYLLPTQGWFSVVCVPHYTAEVAVYLALALLAPLHCWGPKLLLLWVTVNLAVVARQQHTWYLQHHAADVPQSWYKLFPYIW